MITTVATKSNHNTEHSNGLYAYSKTLYRQQNGRLFFKATGGAAMAVDASRRYIDKDAAVDWIASEATDPITGYGYTREQANLMVDGKDAGPGHRDND